LDVARAFETGARRAARPPPAPERGPPERRRRARRAPSPPSTRAIVDEGPSRSGILSQSGPGPRRRSMDEETRVLCVDDPDETAIPAGFDRRAFLMRSAVIRAAAVIHSRSVTGIEQRAGARAP